MPFIEALKYGLTGLAALFGFWAVAQIKARGQAPTEQGAQLINRCMIFSIALLLLSGVLAFYEGYFLRESSRLNAMRPILARMDQTLGDKLALENDAFAPLDAHSKQIVDNMIRQLCQDVIDLSQRASSAVAPRCRARLDRVPTEAPG
ncbi:MAG: hypothetical protein E6G96_01955 [Alphaproteobacteria bacterium]|nr:MAG: hypothetical protein E6G96_01955 [Alphaproteobacteria bacterium]